jgi:hypothetical protein
VLVAPAGQAYCLSTKYTGSLQGQVGRSPGQALSRVFVADDWRMCTLDVGAAGSAAYRLLYIHKAQHTNTRMYTQTKSEEDLCELRRHARPLVRCLATHSTRVQAPRHSNRCSSSPRELLLAPPPPPHHPGWPSPDGVVWVTDAAAGWQHRTWLLTLALKLTAWGESGGRAAGTCNGQTMRTSL